MEPEELGEEDIDIGAEEALEQLPEQLPEQLQGEYEEEPVYEEEEEEPPRRQRKNEGVEGYTPITSWVTDKNVVYKMPVTCIVNLYPPQGRVQPRIITMSVRDPTRISGSRTVRTELPPEFISPKIAVNIVIFELSPTLIHSDRGLDEPEGNDDWVWSSDSIPDVLTNLNENKIDVAIIGTQYDTSIEKLERLVVRTETMLGNLGFQPFVFISLTGNIADAWVRFVTETEIRLLDRRSYYVASEEIDYRDPNIIGLPNYYPPDQMFYNQPDVVLPEYQEILVLVGSPNSNVEAYTNANLTSYLVISPTSLVPTNQDILRDRTGAIEYLKQGYSVVFKGGNPQYRHRAPFISLAIELKIPCRILWFTALTYPADEDVFTYAQVFQRPNLEHDNAEVIRVD